MSFLKQDSNNSLLYIKCSPNSFCTKISEKTLDDKDQEWLKINLTALPESGKANKELISFLSKFLKIPKSKITIIRGEKSRFKIVNFSGIILSESEF